MAKNEFPRRTRASLIIQYFRVSNWNLDDLDYFLARFPNSIPFHNFVYVETFCEYFWRFFFFINFSWNLESLYIYESNRGKKFTSR